MQKIILIIILFIITTVIYSQDPCSDVPEVYYASRRYNTVQIGAQCWLQENLDVGTMIQGNQNQTNNNIIEKYCYNNDPNNCINYGGLYQWDEAMAFSTTPGTKGICPDGWHIPTKAEYETLAAAVSNNGNALKAIGQGSVQYGGVGTNTSGFSTLLTGFRDGYYFNFFVYLGGYTNFWSSSEYNTNNANYMDLGYYDSRIIFSNVSKGQGFSVRCLKDASTTSVEQEEGLPTTFELMQNYPNPFNPSTAISYRLSAFSKVSLKVFDVLGKEVATLVNEYQQPGNFVKTFHGTSLPSGIYFYRLQVYPANGGAGDPSLRSGQGFTDSKKMLLIK